MPYTTYTYCFGCPAVRVTSCSALLVARVDYSHFFAFCFFSLSCFSGPGLLLPLVCDHHLLLPRRLLLSSGLRHVLRLSGGVLLPGLHEHLLQLPGRDLFRWLRGEVRQLRLRPVPELRDLDGL
jgi:hypothetical protein